MTPPSDDGRRWAVLAHALVPFTGCVGLLLIRWRHRHRARYVDDQLAEVANWSILVTASGAVSVVLIAVALGTVLVPLVWFVSAVFAYLGVAAVRRGEAFRYPVTWRFVA